MTTQGRCWPIYRWHNPPHHKTKIISIAIANLSWVFALLLQHRPLCCRPDSYDIPSMRPNSSGQPVGSNIGPPFGFLEDFCDFVLAIDLPLGTADLKLGATNVRADWESPCGSWPTNSRGSNGYTSFSDTLKWKRGWENGLPQWAQAQLKSCLEAMLVSGMLRVTALCIRCWNHGSTVWKKHSFGTHLSFPNRSRKITHLKDIGINSHSYAYFFLIFGSFLVRKALKSRANPGKTVGYKAGPAATASVGWL